MATASVLVCVTGQKNCARLIARGREVAAEHDLPLLVLSVAGSGPNLLADPSFAEALDFLYKESSAAGAEMTLLTSADPLKTIVDFAKAHAVAHLIIGAGRPDSSGHSFAGHLALALPQAQFHTDTGI